MTDATRQLLGHTARALHHRAQIKARLLYRKPEFLGTMHQMEHFRRAQQRLRRDAAPVKTDTAQMLALDNRDLEPQLRAPNGGHIAPRSRTDYNHVKGIRRHMPLRFQNWFSVKLFFTPNQ